MQIGPDRAELLVHASGPLSQRAIRFPCYIDSSLRVDTITFTIEQSFAIWRLKISRPRAASCNERAVFEWRLGSIQVHIPIFPIIHFTCINPAKSLWTYIVYKLIRLAANRTSNRFALSDHVFLNGWRMQSIKGVQTGDTWAPLLSSSSLVVLRITSCPTTRDLECPIRPDRYICMVVLLFTQKAVEQGKFGTEDPSPTGCNKEYRNEIHPGRKHVSMWNSSES